MYYTNIIFDELNNLYNQLNKDELDFETRFAFAAYQIRIFSLFNTLEHKIYFIKAFESEPVEREENMKPSDYVYKITDKLLNKVINEDLSADEKAEFAGMKQEIYTKFLAFERRVNAILKNKPQWVIKLLEDGKFIGYVDYYETEDKEVPTVPALVKDPFDVENDVYDSLEDALAQINILQSTANTYAELNLEEPEITYEPEQRN